MGGRTAYTNHHGGEVTVADDGRTVVISVSDRLGRSEHATSRSLDRQVSDAARRHFAGRSRPALSAIGRSRRRTGNGGVRICATRVYSPIPAAEFLARVLVVLDEWFDTDTDTDAGPDAVDRSRDLHTHRLALLRPYELEIHTGTR